MIANIAIAVFLYAWIEYFVHRFDMHSRGSYRFQSHTVEHHGRMHMGTEQASLTQTNVGIAFWYTMPFTLVVEWLSPGFLFTWMAICFWAGFTWTAVHRCIHGERGYWYAYLLCPWLPIVRWNHLRHHASPRRGFGGMFWFLTDPLAGTF